MTPSTQLQILSLTLSASLCLSLSLSLSLFSLAVRPIVPIYSVTEEVVFLFTAAVTEEEVLEWTEYLKMQVCTINQLIN